MNKVVYFVVAFVVAVALGALYTTQPRPVTSPLLGAAPRFQATASDGAAFDSDSLTGSVWVASFLFTRCPATCPKISASMAKLQTLFHKSQGFHQISLTVDPEYDTPAVLQAFSSRYSAEPSRWTFLTGTKEQLSSILAGFKLGDGQELHHSTRLVLVDRKQRIRGYFDGTDETSLRMLVRATETLIRERES